MRRLFNIGHDVVHIAVVESSDGESDNRWIIRDRDDRDEVLKAAREMVIHWLIDLYPLGDHIEPSLQDEPENEDKTCDDVDFTEDEWFEWILDTCGYQFHMVWDVKTA